MGVHEKPAEERDFVPPFCPYPECTHHRIEKRASWRFDRRGYRRVDRTPGWIRRFVCRTCGRWFSSSTFREDFWTKRPGLAPAVFALIADGTCLRQAARALGVAATTVKRRQRWLAKQCLLQHARLMERLRLSEPVIVDGTRGFAGSRYEAMELNTWVAMRSGLHLELDLVPLRRSGRMTETQRRIREEREKRLGRPDPRARRRATERGLKRIVRRVPNGQDLTLVSDLEPDYARAARRVAEDAGVTIAHTRVSSRARRDGSNPLWRVNQLHQFQRHSLANLRRRAVIAHSKDACGLLDRALIHRTFANMTKGVSERTAALSRVTPAMRAGLACRPVAAEALLRRRRFPAHARLDHEQRAVYERRLKGRPRERVRPDVPVVKY